jgi:hypothetical protein
MHRELRSQFWVELYGERDVLLDSIEPLDVIPSAGQVKRVIGAGSAA